MAAASSIKVSVNGRKYQISGITKQTSCKDLLCALAKSASCDRQLDLFEKWRDCERRLPLNADPLGVLDCWGQEGAKVKFIARERGDDIKTIVDSAVADKKRRSKRQPSKSRVERHHRAKHSEKIRSVDDSDIDENRASHRSYRRGRQHRKSRNYDDLDVDTYADLLGVVIDQAKELKSQARQIRKSDNLGAEQLQGPAKGSKNPFSDVDCAPTVEIDNDNDSGVRSIGDDSSQGSISRDGNNHSIESRVCRSRMDSNLAPTPTAEYSADTLNEPDRRSNRLPLSSRKPASKGGDDFEDAERSNIWLSYQELCVQLCEVLERISTKQLMVDSIANDFKTLDNMESVERQQLTEEQLRIDKELDITKSLIKSVKELTSYQHKEISTNSRELDQYEGNLKPRQMLYNSLTAELQRIQLRTAPRRLLKRCQPDRDMASILRRGADGVSFV